MDQGRIKACRDQGRIKACKDQNTIKACKDQSRIKAMIEVFSLFSPIDAHELFSTVGVSDGMLQCSTSRYWWSGHRSVEDWWWQGRGEKQCNLLQRSLNSLSLHIYSGSADSVCIDVVSDTSCWVLQNLHCRLQNIKLYDCFFANWLCVSSEQFVICKRLC